MDAGLSIVVELTRFALESLQSKEAFTTLTVTTMVIGSYHFFMIKPIKDDHALMSEDYKQCQKDLENRLNRKIDDKFIMGINQVTNAVERIEGVFSEHKEADDIRNEVLSNQLSGLVSVVNDTNEAMNEIRDDVQLINNALVRQDIKKAKYSSKDWLIVMERLVGTAESTFDKAIDACRKCKEFKFDKNGHCALWKAFQEETKARVADSWEVFTQESVSPELLKVLENVNKLGFSKVDKEWLPALTNKCLNEHYQKLGVDAIAKINETEAKVLKQSVIDFWENELKKRVKGG